MREHACTSSRLADDRISRSQAIAACTGASSSILTVDASRWHQWPVQSDGEGPSFGAAGALYGVRVGQMTRTCQRRSVCCLYFKSSARYFCASCSISPESGRLERNRSWVAKQAAIGAAIDGRAKLETVIRDEHRSQRRLVQSHRRRVLRSRLTGEQSAMPRNEDLAQSRGLPVRDLNIQRPFRSASACVQVPML